MIKCENRENNEKMLKEIRKISNLDCEVNLLEMQRPRIKLVDVSEDFDPDGVADGIMSQNFENCAKDDLKVIHILKNQKKRH